MEKTITIKTETTTNYKFNAEQVRNALGLSKNTELFITVPGGGDWSNCDLFLTEVLLQGILIETKEVEESYEDDDNNT